MAKQDAFTTDEWAQLRLAPALLSAGVAAADPSGIFATVKEASAGMQSMIASLKSRGELELFAAMAADGSLPGMPDPKLLVGEGSRDAQRQQLKRSALERAKAAADVVARKASPAEAEAYRDLLVEVAQKAAHASKEGGFLGIGGVRVSDDEQAYVDEVKRAVGRG